MKFVDNKNCGYLFRKAYYGRSQQDNVFKETRIKNLDVSAIVMLKRTDSSSLEKNPFPLLSKSCDFSVFLST